jgi:gamma-glutamylcyclotransferase (GGCT)/AIG2-like uncharacterized protein YtfP
MVKLLPLFVYGTARVGQGLHHVIEDAVHDSVLVQAPRMQLMVGKTASFPYLVRTENPADKVWGDLLLVERGRDLMRLCEIEGNCGYTFEGIRIESGIDWAGDFALAFVWAAPTDYLEPWGSPSWLSRHLQAAR